jgi:hypothetical protein
VDDDDILGRWWRGPLDVESLALDATRHLCLEVSELVGRRAGTSPELIAASFAAIEHLRIDGRPVVPWAPLSGFVEADDGWVRFHGNYPHHAAAITTALGAASREELAAAVRRLPAQDVEDAVVAAGGVATVVRTVEQWAAHPHGAATMGRRIDGITMGDEHPRSFPAERPLHGVRVLDLTRVIAGPTCSQVLACLGADVLRIDPPHRPELLDAYLSNGMGKRSAVADLDIHQEAVRELAATADVVLLGYRPGSLDRFGLSPDLLSVEHPHLVVGSLSAWGEIGPWAQRPGFDSIVQAATGIAALCAAPDGRPGALPVQALDHATGLSLATHVISHLVAGAGGVIRLSLLQTAYRLLERRSPNEVAVRLRAPKVRLRSPHGRIVTVPPPVLVGRKKLTGPISEYGAAPLAWRPLVRS